MRSSNKLGLILCLAMATGWGGWHVEASQAKGRKYPQSYPQPVPPNNPQAQPTGPAEGTPPPSAGPSGTSGDGVDRYDEVGYATWYGDELAAARTASGAKFDPDAFTAAHRTLPLGSFVEVTSLQTGHTILVQINDRGPSNRGLLIDLSHAAAQSLGISGRGAVRVRRVTATADDDAAIRAGRPGAPRLDTPPALLAGLKQRLTGGAPEMTPRLPQPVITDTAQPAPAAAIKPGRRIRPAPVIAKPAGGPGYYVQVAAFSTQQRARTLAQSMGGSVQAGGALWRVRLGPYANGRDAAQARDGAAKRGYADARVVREN